MSRSIWGGGRRARQRIASGSCLLIVVAGAGCGGSTGRLSTSAYVQQASAICVAANQGLRQIDVPPLSQSHDAQHALRLVVTRGRQAVDDLRRLHPPTTLGPLHQRWIALLDQSLDELDAVQRNLQRDRPTVAARYAGEASRLAARAKVLVRPHGVASCTSPAIRLP